VISLCLYRCFGGLWGTEFLRTSLFECSFFFGVFSPGLCPFFSMVGRDLRFSPFLLFVCFCLLLFWAVFLEFCSASVLCVFFRSLDVFFSFTPILYYCSFLQLSRYRNSFPFRDPSVFFFFFHSDFGSFCSLRFVIVLEFFH